MESNARSDTLTKMVKGSDSGFDEKRDANLWAALPREGIPPLSRGMVMVLRAGERRL